MFNYLHVNVPHWWSLGSEAQPHELQVFLPIEPQIAIAVGSGIKPVPGLVAVLQFVLPPAIFGVTSPGKTLLSWDRDLIFFFVKLFFTLF